MTKKILVDSIADLTNLTKKDVQTVLDALPGALNSAAKAAGRVQLPGVCTVKVVNKEARTGRNPKTGESIQIPARTVIKLTPIGELKAFA